MKKMLFCAALLIALLMVSASAEDRLRVVATDFPCYDFARQAAGERADVTLLIHPGVEVHSYEPAPADILAIGEADLFVYIGGEGDAWADGILSGFDGSDGPTALRLMDAVTPLEEADEPGHAHDAPEYDEHIWTDPKNAMAMVRAIGAALAELDAANADAYRAAAEEYANEIARVDEAFRQVVDSGARREIVFADRFPFLYFTQAYGLDWFAAFPSCTAETEPTPQTMLALIKKVRDDGLPAVYTIEMSTQSVARTVAEETGTEILTMHSLQTVTQDEFDAGETYVSLMRRNVAALEKGLN